MDAAHSDRRCPNCNQRIPTGSPQELCPPCVLQAATAPTETGLTRMNADDAPSLSEVTAAFPYLEVHECIGHGGMGFVYKARQTKLDRWVALKILPERLAQDPLFAERFHREGQTLARLTHPNIVSVHDFGESGGFCFLLMEYVDGVNLRQAMRAGRFSPAEALSIVPKICEALQYAHEQGVMHRDIKPENILLNAKGAVKIADFGIAKLLHEELGNPTLTQTGGTLGTPHYMAPEQLEQPGQVDHRADIYSLGVVFYEMLTGELPLGRFAAPSDKATVDRSVDEVVFRTLEKERGRRFQTAAELGQTVRSLTEASIQPSPDSHSRPPDLKLKGGPVWVSIVLGLMLVGAGMWFMRRSNRPLQQVIIPPNSEISGQIVLDPGKEEGVGSVVKEHAPKVTATEHALAAIPDSLEIIRFEIIKLFNNQLVLSSTKPLPGDESLTTRIQYPDGRIEDVLPALWTTRGDPNGPYLYTANCHWLPTGWVGNTFEELAEEHHEVSEKQTLSLVLGEWLPVYSASTRSGGSVRVFIGRMPAATTDEGVTSPMKITLVSGSAGAKQVSVRPILSGPLNLRPEAVGTLDGAEAVSAETNVIPRSRPVGGGRFYRGQDDGETPSSNPNNFMRWTMPDGFGEQEAMVIMHQLNGWIDTKRTILLTAGRRMPLFSATNRSGFVFVGSLEIPGRSD